MIDKYYGETEKNVKALFSLAKKVEPVIILVDEIDCMLQTRSESTNEAKNFMAEFLVRMDDIQKNTLSKTIIFAATNRLEDVDAAILRRLPMKFKVDKPDLAARSSIIQNLLREYETDFDIKKLAENTLDFTGSEIFELCRSAAVNALAEKMQCINIDKSDMIEEPLLIKFEHLDEKVKNSFLSSKLECDDFSLYS